MFDTFDHDEEKPVGEKSLESTKKRSLKILGSRQMSASDMKKRLIEKGESEENANETVLWLEKIGGINDKDFAEAICLHYSKKGYGAVRIKEELYRRKIEKYLWDDALALICQDETNDAAMQFLHKKLRGSDDKDDIRRAANALCRRGFSYEDAKKAVSEYFDNLENSEEWS